MNSANRSFSLRITFHWPFFYIFVGICKGVTEKRVYQITKAQERETVKTSTDSSRWKYLWKHWRVTGRLVPWGKHFFRGAALNSRLARGVCMDFTRNITCWWRNFTAEIFRLVIICARKFLLQQQPIREEIRHQFGFHTSFADVLLVRHAILSPQQRKDAKKTYAQDARIEGATRKFLYKAYSKQFNTCILF